MVVRKKQRDRKYQGTRRWGVGNIKNARGKGDQGGTGSVNRRRKHDWTYITAKARHLMKKKGFYSINRRDLKQINLIQLSAMIKEQGSTIELNDYKVLGNGTLEKPATIKAASFSKHAAEKIKSSGGEAIVIE
jgi:large subunit ribosomal protein L15